MQKEYYVENYGYILVDESGEIINNKGKILKHKISSDGYEYIRVHYKNYRQLELAKERYMFQKDIHRLIAECFIENPNNFSEVNHKDGNKRNNNISNLEWCTRSQNIQHAFDNGLKFGSKGIENGRAKLTYEQVAEIRKMLSENKTKASIARMFGVGWTTIQHIAKNDTWN